MRVETFRVEKWLNEYEHDVEINISETCVEPFTIGEFLHLMGRENFFNEMWDTQLTYGYIPGSQGLRDGISKLYSNLQPENILIEGGAIGANFLVLYSLVEPGDKVLSIVPTYQQLYSVPRSFGADVKLLRLKMDENWLPNLEKLKKLVDDETKLIIINNPNNPTGSLIGNEMLNEICEIANEVGAYLLSDESYRGVYVNPSNKVSSVVELYDKGISTGSFSKPFSLTGLRLGWVSAKEEIIRLCEDRRDYTTISTGLLDDAIATLAVENVEKIDRRNNEIVQRNYKILSEWVNNEPLIDWIPPKGGTIAFLRYNLNMTSEELCLKLIEEKSLLLVPGTCFETEGFVRIGWGADTDTLIEGLSRFKMVLNSI